MTQQTNISNVIKRVQSIHSTPGFVGQK